MIVGTSYAPECIEWFRKRHEARETAENATQTPDLAEALQSPDGWQTLPGEYTVRVADPQ